MSLTLVEYRCKLVNQILFAGSQGEVQRIVEAGLKGLETDTVNGSTVAKFLQEIVSDLTEFNPVNYNAQQWSNIKMARVLFNRAKAVLRSEAT